MISPLDLAAAKENAETFTAKTNHICGSVSLPDYRNHLTDLENAKDALASCRNELKKTIDELRNEQREVERIIDKVEDHWQRTKVAGNDVRWAKPDNSQPKQ